MSQVKRMLMEKKIKTMGSLEYLTDFQKTIEIPLINCEINLVLNWYAKYLITYISDKT